MTMCGIILTTAAKRSGFELPGLFESPDGSPLRSWATVERGGGLLVGSHPVAEQVVLVAEEQPSGRHNGVGPCHGVGVSGRLEAARFAIGFGGGFDQGDGSVFAADIQVSVRAGQRTLPHR